MDGISKELLCNFTDPVLISVVTAVVLLALAILRSISVHGTRHSSLHMLVGSDLILAVVVLSGVQAARIYQKIQCLGHDARNPANLSSINVSLLVVSVSLMLLILCSAVERVAFQNGRASGLQVFGNLSLGFVASLCSIGVVAQQLVK